MRSTLPAQPPTHRPTWLVVLGAIMVLAGGSSLVAGLKKFRDPIVVFNPMFTGTAGSHAEMELGRKLAAVSAATVAPYGTALRITGGFEVAAALLTLYAAAAVFSRDRHGRMLALAVALLGIAYQLGTLPVYLRLMRDYAARGVPLLAQAWALQTKTGDSDARTLSAEELASRLPAVFVGWTVLVAGLSIAGSLVLMRYFGGRRGRTLYGVEPAPTEAPQLPRVD